MAASLNPVESDGEQVEEQVARLLVTLTGSMTRDELQAALRLEGRRNFSERYLNPALAAGLIEMTIPDKPNSRLQKYRLTSAGKAKRPTKTGERK